MLQNYGTMEFRFTMENLWYNGKNYGTLLNYNKQ